MLDVQGKVAVITGASAGFGCRLAQRLHAKGAQVVLGDIDVSEGQALADQLNRARPDSAVFQKCDVSQIADNQGLFDLAVRQFGTADIMINNAGVAESHPVFAEDSTTQAWEKLLAINLQAVIAGTQYAVNYWLRHRKSGVVVSASSASAFSFLPISPVYAATKAAVLHFTSNCATLKKQGIRVNAIAPFFSNTNLVKQGRQDNKHFDRLVSGAKMVDPEMVVDAYMRCIEDESLAGETLSILPKSGIQIFHPYYPKL
ncbi:hypothetical protein H4R33_001519 [Dimargaris cristalligena]|uniref:15-hydroxyprostaglandin dehydrogenase n=1 Tax=Dimargaris cristalligena TaxID=215637 RepID=A0A4Q0A1H1_9FUNG|nr:hypothetical protein H4R33_001519 [Dimargaris cristalligena]RKP39915.1 hypothetical protein BJ085DRAFT_22722 [Dimargaris cristalligena]|eukprot:RKP39915.1 hypothetical protein BJ085DRAFT_22722 [Dimargaris cristalligena]